MGTWTETEFCWADIGTTDMEGAKKFYEQVFNWQYVDFPMPDGSTYTMWKADGVESGGLYALNDDQKKMGVPPHWMNYLHTENADTFVEKAKNGGGQVVAPPFDVPEMGRTAIVQDPAGAMVSCWQPFQNEKNLAPKYTPGKIAWRELLTNNVERAGKFYCDLVGWDISSADIPEGGKYHTFKKGDSHEGGMMAIQKEWGDNVHCQWVTFINVDDCQAAAEKIKSIGGQMLTEVFSVPEVGNFAYAVDPYNASFGIANFKV